MEAIKGLARRATQSAKQKIGSAEATHDEQLISVSGKVRTFEKAANNLSDKVLKITKIVSELGSAVQEFGEEYLTATEVGTEQHSLGEELVAFGSEVASRVADFEKLMKEGAFDHLTSYLKEVPKLKEAEEDRRKKQLEFDFFKNKVNELRKNPPKDSTRLPRNEGILENWRRELHMSTENNKAVASQLYAHGQFALDTSAVNVAQGLNTYLIYAVTSAKQHVMSAHMPTYPPGPILPPMQFVPAPNGGITLPQYTNTTPNVPGFNPGQYSQSAFPPNQSSQFYASPEHQGQFQPQSSGAFSPQQGFAQQQQQQQQQQGPYFQPQQPQQQPQQFSPQNNFQQGGAAPAQQQQQQFNPGQQGFNPAPNFSQGPPPQQNPNFNQGPPPGFGPGPQSHNNFAPAPGAGPQQNFQQGPPQGQNPNFQQGPPPQGQNFSGPPQQFHPQQQNPAGFNPSPAPQQQPQFNAGPPQGPPQGFNAAPNPNFNQGPPNTMQGPPNTMQGPPNQNQNAMPPQQFQPPQQRPMNQPPPLQPQQQPPVQQQQQQQVPPSHPAQQLFPPEKSGPPPSG